MKLKTALIRAACADMSILQIGLGISTLMTSDRAWKEYYPGFLIPHHSIGLVVLMLGFIGMASVLVGSVKLWQRFLLANIFIFLAFAHGFAAMGRPLGTVSYVTLAYMCALRFLGYSLALRRNES